MRIILFLLIISLTQSQAYGQLRPKAESRQIIIADGDTLIRAYVLTSRQSIKTKSDSRYYWYYQNKIHSNIGGFSGKLLHGRYEVMAYGYLIRQGEFLFGQKSGQWSVWDSSGELLEKTFWQSGKRNGPFYFHFPENDSTVIGKYKNDIVTGKVEIHCSDSIYYINPDS